MERREQGLSDIQRLLDQFGRSNLIPQRELANAGYGRKVGPDGTIILSPLKPSYTIERNNKKIAFDPFTIIVATKQDVFRHISQEGVVELDRKLNKLATFLTDSWDDYELDDPPIAKDRKTENIRTFFDDFVSHFLQAYFPQNVEGEKDWPVVDRTTIESAFSFPLPFTNYQPLKDFNPYFFLAKYKDLDTSTIGSAQSKDMQVELIRLMSRCTDIPELQKIFKARLEASTARLLNDLPSEEEKENLSKFFVSHNIQTLADFIRFAFPVYLDQVGLSTMSQTLRTSQNLSTVAGDLKKLEIIDSAYEEEKNIRGKLKTAPQEERVLLNQRLKEIEKEKKHRKKIQSGVIDYFDSPSLYAQLVKDRIQEIQDFLVVQKSQESSQVQLVIDPAPDKNLDQDPGLVSGDCTQGMPLPFKRPDTHNVKVFVVLGKNEKKHIGNMYLLETISGMGKKTWHFDAIQIPYPRIPWEEFVEKLVYELAQQAEQKGVRVITVNQGKHLISNYDYIRDAVRKFWKAHSGIKTVIDIPIIVSDLEQIILELQETISDFQGTGKALVLWRKKKKQLPLPPLNNRGYK